MMMRQKNADVICPHCEKLVAYGVLFCSLCNKIQPIQNIIASDYYALLSMEESPAIDLAELQDKASERLRLVHPDCFVKRSVLEKQIALENAALYNKAYSILVSPLLRIEYILNKHGYKAEMSEELLAELFAWRENLERAADQEDLEKIIGRQILIGQ